jgi:protocatechuate 3,4-dioxygenase beta subunit
MNSLIKIHTFFFLATCFYACAQKPIEQKAETISTPSQAQATKTVKSFPGGACPDCNLMFLGMPLVLSAVDTTEGWFEKGQKLKIEGTIFQPDQKTPAAEVIVYFYHTDPSGQYVPKKGMLPSSRKHGYLRGWVKTGPDGRYAIYTSRPAQYPNENVEAHIHVFVKEPSIDVPYMIDEWIFDDDPLVTKELRKRIQDKGGKAILEIDSQMTSRWQNTISSWASTSPVTLSNSLLY